MSYIIKYTSRFKKEYKLMKKRGYDLKLLEKVISILVQGTPLPSLYKDHPLKSNWEGYRECHIQSDWLLIYKYQNE